MKDFDALVRLKGDHLACVNVSKLSKGYIVLRLSDVVSEDEEVWVKVFGISNSGKVRISLAFAEDKDMKAKCPKTAKQSSE